MTWAGHTGDRLGGRPCSEELAPLPPVTRQFCVFSGSPAEALPGTGENGAVSLG